MAVTVRHREYDKRSAEWALMRDVIEGDRAVKEQGEHYLPKPAGQTHRDYAAYKKRAPFEAATGRTLGGMVGLIFRKPPTLTLPDNPLSAALELDVTNSGLPLAFFARFMAEEAIGLGRFGIIVDRAMGEGSRSFLRGYTAECLRMWRYGVTAEGRRELRLVILEEQAEVIDDDGFGSTMERRLRVLRLLDGRYQVEVWAPENPKHQGDKDNWVMREGPLVPTMRGQPLDFIPFEIVGDDDGVGDTVCPPLYGIAELNLAHYRTAADLHHALHMVALPTPWVADDHPGGLSGDRPEYLIGSGTAWLLGPQGSAGMLEVSGQGIASLREELLRLERRMAALGGRMLESQQKDVEAAETLRLRQTGESSVLTNMADRLSINLTRALRWALWWDGLVQLDDEEAVNCQLNTDFFDTKLAGAEIGQLVAGWQMGAYPWEVLAWNLRQGEVIPQSMTDEELKRLLAGEGRSQDNDTPFGNADTPANIRAVA